MELTLRTLTNEEMTQLYTARQARFATLEGFLKQQPANAETRFAQRLLARARYTTWLDLQESEKTLAGAR